MKNKISITQRDRNLLTILIFILAAFVLYYFIISPQLSNNQFLREDVRNIKAEHERVTQIVNELPQLNEKESSQKKMLSEKYKVFFYEINQERLLHRFNSLITNANLNVGSISISDTEAAQISVNSAEYTPVSYPLLDLAAKTNPDLIENDNNAQINSDGSASDILGRADFGINFSGSYENIYKLINDLETFNRSIIITDINMAKGDGGNLQGNIILSTYSMPKPDEIEKNDLKFEPVNPKGKANPFY